MNEISWNRLRPAYASALVSSFGYFILAFIIPILMYPDMTDRATDVALVLSMMTLGMAIFAPLAGRISLRTPVKTILTGSILRAVSNLGMAIAILEFSLLWLTVSSLLWGIGGAFYVVGIESEISEQVIRDRRAEAFGRLQSVNNIGSMIGAFIAFFILGSMHGNPVIGFVGIFVFFSGTSIIGGGLICINHKEKSPHPHIPVPTEHTQRLRSSAYVLVFTFVITTFIAALVSPFVELYVIATVSNDIVLVAFTYLPGAVFGAILGPRLGRISDRGGRISLLVTMTVVGSVSVILIVVVPYIAPTISIALSPIFGTNVMYTALFLIAVLFTSSTVATTAVFVIMISAMGTAYEGAAGHGIGVYETSLAIARVAGPIAGGIMWDVSSPATPILVVGMIGLFVTPLYYMGIQQYEGSLRMNNLPDNSKPENAMIHDTSEDI